MATNLESLLQACASNSKVRSELPSSTKMISCGPPGMASMTARIRASSSGTTVASLYTGTATVTRDGSLTRLPQASRKARVVRLFNGFTITMQLNTFHDRAENTSGLGGGQICHARKERFRFVRTNGA